MRRSRRGLDALVPWVARSVAMGDLVDARRQQALDSASVAFLLGHPSRYQCGWMEPPAQPSTATSAVYRTGSKGAFRGPERRGKSNDGCRGPKATDIECQCEKKVLSRSGGGHVCTRHRVGCE